MILTLKHLLGVRLDVIQPLSAFVQSRYESGVCYSKQSQRPHIQNSDVDYESINQFIGGITSYANSCKIVLPHEFALTFLT